MLRHARRKRYKYPERLKRVYVFGIFLEFCSHCELVSCQKLSAIVGAVTVIINDLLSAFSANLCKCCSFRVTCALGFLEYSLNKTPFSIIHHLDCFHRTPTGRFS
ncbi:hypothetical protein AVEN_128375-1 [Araneus ventricosus]|uniref:Uncharacterized protein n=1 Tax=Araneus ventricosus TaxID=182803 RepID=A0A4Y2EGX7_ARAVE|nr:hypothetical protein AVEN_113245-1 [Araneus ventricosus]GBM27516.1 hypothetical protein AVEN_128375-1 [Araneus ventricosus]